ncbi:DUF5590 domain-containing protein [Paenibacillus thermotolerans]|uniref:cell wall elongation regulator TseB-like domain-containing protein n=1 Tax=Paenibacillus thermotolerans TaxID=3027807 RepID=UPI0023682134|nr:MULTISPECIES: DUF5590 domain-containing protein [unclassified Paenibacillus]
MAERVISGRNKRPLWLHRTLAILLLIIVLSIVFGNRLFNTIQRPLWDKIASAEAAAVEKLNIKDVTEADRFIGDKAYTVLFATNPAGEKVVVWVWDDGLHVEKASAGLTKEEVKQLALADAPGKHILRIIPGKLRDEYVWEVFYTKLEDGSTRHYYDYYRFSDGQKLDTYRLAKFS